jgi:hypothetical protein
MSTSLRSKHTRVRQGSRYPPWPLRQPPVWVARAEAPSRKVISSGSSSGVHRNDGQQLGGGGPEWFRAGGRALDRGLGNVGFGRGLGHDFGRGLGNDLGGFGHDRGLGNDFGSFGHDGAFGSFGHDGGFGIVGLGRGLGHDFGRLFGDRGRFSWGTWWAP